MQHTAHTSSLVGLEGVPVTVEAEVMAAGLPALDLAGLQENALREARTRVRAGMEQMGYSFPTKRVQVVISPADLRKTGGYDLAIAVAILTAMGECSPDALPAWMLLGELSLTGVLRGVRGVLSQVQAAKARGFLGVIVPAENAAEAALVSGIVVHSAHTLREVVDFLSRRGELPVASPRVPSELKPDYALDLRDVKGQDGAKRALEIAAAGGHHLLLVGSPGRGKTILARVLPGLLPAMTPAEALEVTAVQSATGLLRDGSLAADRPFRAPHHTASASGLAGGGSPARPGEFSLAHQGVLFLDEATEFPRESMEALRAPLEHQTVTLVSARERATLPAAFQLVMAMNPCPCGYYGDPSGRCDCPADRIERFRKRITEPVRDRIDLMVSLTPVSASTLTAEPTGPTSAEVRERVTAARAMAAARGVTLNAHLDAAQVRALKMTPGGEALRISRSENMPVQSMRCALKVARTIADLAGSDLIDAGHLMEALSFREAFAR